MPNAAPSRLLTIAALGALVACAPLLDYSDLSGGGGEAGTDAGSGTDAHGDAGTGATDGGGTEASAADAKSDVDPCADSRNGWYCATDALDNYPGKSNDLVYCSNQKLDTTKTFNCPAACLKTAFSFPDMCDGCAGKAQSGTYCGDEFPNVAGAGPYLAPLLVTCSGGVASGSVGCDAGCVHAAAGTSHCQ